MSRYVNDQMDINETLAKEFNEKRTGRFKMSCINPEHRDSDASLEVYGENRGAYCFGCGKSYFPLDVIMFKRDINYYQALQVAETEYNIELPTKEGENKIVPKDSVIRYNSLLGVPIKNKKALHNLCVVLKAIEDDNIPVYDKYKADKGIL